MDTAAAWTGYGLWALAIAAGIAFCAWVTAIAAQALYDHLHNVWTLRHQGHLGAVHEILQDPDRNGIQKVNEAFRMTRHGLRGTSMTADEVENGRACPACDHPVRPRW